MNKKLLEIRKRMKARKPVFADQDSHKRKRIRLRWKSPTGYQSKMRHCKKGHRPIVTSGYGSPKEVCGLHPSGMERIRVFNEEGLEKISKETQGAEIASSIGNKKRIIIIKKAEEKGITILNIKNTKAFIRKIEEKKKQRQEAKKKKEDEKKSEKKKAEVKKEKKVPKLEEKIAMTEEEKKEAEKREKDKLLTKREL